MTFYSARFRETVIQKVKKGFYYILVYPSKKFIGIYYLSTPLIFFNESKIFNDA